MKGLVLQSVTDPDEKVSRWAFNGLAQLGEASDVDLMLEPWKNSRQQPAVFEAGLTALAKLVPKARLMNILKAAEVELSPNIIMSLAQQTDEFAAELRKLHLRVDTATIDELRAATLLIGLRRAPDTLFSQYFPVSDVIGDLNSHNDTVIAQYSFWATVEHPDLGLVHVRVSPNNFSNLAPNVQAWAYRTLTKDGNVAIRHYDAIVSASESRHAEVREGMATGLRDIYYDSLDITIADWFVEENDVAVRDRLLEHMATHINKSPAYRDEVMKAYRGSANGSVLRSRLEAANRDDEIALEMRRIILQTSDPDLFASMRGQPMTNNQNFYGSVTGGVSNSGTGNSGPIQIITSAEAHATVIPILAQLLQSLEGKSAPAAAAAGVGITREAIAQPTRGKVERVTAWLKSVKDGGEAVGGIGTLLVGSYDKLTPLLQKLPDMF